MFNLESRYNPSSLNIATSRDLCCVELSLIEVSTSQYVWNLLPLSFASCDSPSYKDLHTDTSK